MTPRKKNKRKIKKPRSNPKINQTLQKIPKEPSSEKIDPELAKDLEELNKMFLTIGFYPVAADITKRDEAKNSIIQKYNKGGDVIKQNIVHLIFENLTQFWDFRVPFNFGFFKSKFPNEEPKKLKLSTYRAIFNFYSSIEGSIFLISLLGELKDTTSAKLLTHLFNYYSAFDSERFRMLRIAIIDALGESDSDYAIRTLITYANNTDSDRLTHKIFSVLMKWDEKIDSFKWESSEKRKIKKSLNELISVLKNNEDSYVR
ncbi:MAG: hypothetical protein WC501_04565 [Candidatus Micrarchaeia archaeon]